MFQPRLKILNLDATWQHGGRLLVRIWVVRSGPTRRAAGYSGDQTLRGSGSGPRPNRGSPGSYQGIAFSDAESRVFSLPLQGWRWPLRLGGWSRFFSGNTSKGRPQCTGVWATPPGKPRTLTYPTRPINCGQPPSGGYSSDQEGPRPNRGTACKSPDSRLGTYTWSA